MKYYFLRHGETVEGAEGVILGNLPGRLSAAGKAQMASWAERFLRDGVRFEKIVSSDLARAARSAKILSGKLGVPVEFAPLARERSAGAAEGKRENEIAWAPYEKKAFPYRKHAGGESFLDVKNRARAFLKSLKKTGDGNVLVVSHSVFIGMVAAAICGVTMAAGIKMAKGGALSWDARTEKISAYGAG